MTDEMDELEACRPPRWSTLAKLRLIGGLVILISVPIVVWRAGRSSDEAKARAEALDRHSTIIVSGDGSITWDGIVVSGRDLTTLLAAEREKPGQLSIVIIPRSDAPAGAVPELMDVVKRAVPTANVSVNGDTSINDLRKMEGLGP